MKVELVRVKEGMKLVCVNFYCLMLGGVIIVDYVWEKVQVGEMGEVLIVVVVEGKNGW